MDASLPAKPTVASARSPVVDRAVYLLRRGTAWVVDGTIMALPLLVVGFGASLFSIVVVGSAFAAAGGGLEGLFAGSAVGVASVLMVLLLIPVAMVAVPAFYLRWAARRSGPGAGQTVGQQLFGLRVVRMGDNDRPVRGRTLIGHALLCQVVLLALAVPPLVVVGTTESVTLGNLTWVLLIAAVLWRAADRRLPHDRLTGLRVEDLTAEQGGWDVARWNAPTER